MGSKQRQNHLLAELDCELSFGWGHLVPEGFEVVLQELIVGLFVKSQGEIPVGGRKVARRARSGGIERAERDHSFRVRLLGVGFEQTNPLVAILRRAAAVDIALRFGDGVVALDRRNCTPSR